MEYVQGWKDISWKWASHASSVYYYFFKNLFSLRRFGLCKLVHKTSELDFARGDLRNEIKSVKNRQCYTTTFLFTFLDVCGHVILTAEWKQTAIACLLSNLARAWLLVLFVFQFSVSELRAADFPLRKGGGVYGTEKLTNEMGKWKSELGKRPPFFQWTNLILSFQLQIFESGIV